MNKVILVNGIDFNIECDNATINVTDINDNRIAFIEADDMVEMAFYNIWDEESGARGEESAPREIYDALIEERYDEVVVWLCDISFL